MWKRETRQGVSVAASSFIVDEGICLQFPERSDQESVELPDGTDIDFFFGGMGVFDGGSERYHIHIGIVSSDDTAFQSCVYGNDAWVLFELLVVCFLHEPQYIGMEIGFPSWVRSGEHYFCARQSETAPDDFLHFFFAALNGTACQT